MFFIHFYSNLNMKIQCISMKIPTFQLFTSFDSCTCQTGWWPKCDHLEVYFSNSLLLYDEEAITSASEVQQELFEPLSFALAIDDIIREIWSSLNVWYLNMRMMVPFKGQPDVVSVDRGLTLCAVDTVRVVSFVILREMTQSSKP